MAATYYKIDRTEFEDFLAAYDAERVDVDGVKELVYDIPTDGDGVVVRVFSAIDGDGSRDAGRDAIRVLAWGVTADVPLASATRTHRIDTWKDNLAPKIDDMVARADAGEFDDETPDATLAGLVPKDVDEDAVVVDDIVDTRYGRKAVLASPYDAKDAIKSLDWDDTHRSWDDARGAWTVDVEAIPMVADELADAGWPLRRPPVYTVDDDVPMESDIEFLADTARRGDEIVVEYEQKNGNGENTKSGELVATDAASPRLAFRRDDGVHMEVDIDARGRPRLLSPRSHAPYVGEPTDFRMA